MPSKFFIGALTALPLSLALWLGIVDLAGAHYRHRLERASEHALIKLDSEAKRLV